MPVFLRFQSAVKVSTDRTVNPALEDSSIPATTGERLVKDKIAQFIGFMFLDVLATCSAWTVSTATAHAAVSQASRASPATSARIQTSMATTVTKVTCEAAKVDRLSQGANLTGRSSQLKRWMTSTVIDDCDDYCAFLVRTKLPDNLRLLWHLVPPPYTWHWLCHSLTPSDTCWSLLTFANPWNAWTELASQSTEVSCRNYGLH